MNRTWTAPVAADRRTFDPAEVFAAGLRNHHITNTAYPIAHNETWGPYRVRRAGMDAAATRGWEGLNDLGLYVHIPFCEVRCSFCEYTVVGKGELSYVDDYMTDLLREFDLYKDMIGTQQRTLHGFDIGGGTPSFVSADWIARVVEKARACFRFDPAGDISIETTPRIAAAEPEKLAAYRRVGIDRISMGIQVIQPDLLRVLNRSSNGVEHHYRAVDNIRTAGFERFNVDLMYGFAGQSLASWEATLAHAIALGPEYITLYRMRYKLTRISHQAHRVTLDAVRPMMQRAKAMLHDAGYYANPGKTTYSRLPGDVGTSSYLAKRVTEGMPYLGLGLGAQSFTHTTISYNDGSAGKNLTPYRKSMALDRLPFQDLYDLPACHMMAKMCCVSFYFGEINRAAFYAKFGVSLEEAFPAEVRFLLDEGLMTYTDHALRNGLVSPLESEPERVSSTASPDFEGRTGSTGRKTEAESEEHRAAMGRKAPGVAPNDRTKPFLSLTPKGTLYKNGVIGLFHAPSVKQYLINRDPETGPDLEKNRKMALRVAQRGAHV